MAAARKQRIKIFCFLFVFTVTILSLISGRQTNQNSTKVDSSLATFFLNIFKGAGGSRQEAVIPPCKVYALKHKTDFYDYFQKYNSICKKKEYFGRGPDKKGVCLDPEFGLEKGNCHVLSFGINNEWSFDDAFDRYGCKVYSFDPTMKKKDFNRTENIRFFNLGLGNIQGQRKVGMHDKFTMLNVDRYENILKRLGLTNKKIDYLKLDIEISELEFFQDIFGTTPHLLKNIKQLAVEVHHGDHGEGIYDIENKLDEMGPMSAYQLFWQYIQLLKCNGFQLAEARKNWKWTEAVWVNP